MTQNSKAHKYAARVLATSIVVCAVPGAPALFVAQAHAQTEVTQVSYPCKYAPVGYETLARSEPMPMTITIDAPVSVSPGQTVSLTGRVSMRLPDAFATLAAQYSKEAELVISDMELPVSIGGQSSAARVSRVQSGKVSTQVNPLALGGSTTLSDIVIPPDATGEIRVDMPTTGSATSQLDASPAAFNASLTVTGGPVGPYQTVNATISCASTPDDPRSIAVFPIAVSPALPAESNSVQPHALSSAAAIPASPGGDPAAPASPPVTAAANPSTSVGLPNTNDNAAVIPLNYRTDGLFVPGWWVLSVVVLGGILTTGFAAWTYYRFRRLRHELEG
ncbi:hypothetical protein O4220_13310 [Rhodococcus ruber]|uniref:Uncharacterized protein n=1 Tax=Rhodococcus ruber TaxID=1830 RepID=A0ABT4MID9_9NOCA|nr:hypothetical protein [Rhodococcus ruber]MCZ4519496.1 hypothetical protein [Rhodococcus ruber]